MLANALGYWRRPGHNHGMGACAAGNSSLMQEHWDLSEERCSVLCIQAGSECLAYEYSRLGGRGQYSKCELHSEAIQRTVPSPGAVVCRMKPEASTTSSWVPAHPSVLSVPPSTPPPPPPHRPPDARVVQLRWRRDSLMLVYDAKKVHGNHRFVHSPTVLNNGDGVDHIFTCHNHIPRTFSDWVYYINRREDQEALTTVAMYPGVRYPGQFGVWWGDLGDWPWQHNYYWNACEPAVLARTITYRRQKFNNIMFHTSMPIERFNCIRYLEDNLNAPAPPNRTCLDESEANDIHVVYFDGLHNTETLTPLQHKFLRFSPTVNKPQPRPFEYGIGQPSIATFGTNGTWLFHTYGDSEGVYTRWNVHFSPLHFDDNGEPHLPQLRELSKRGITDLFGRQVDLLSNVDVTYDAHRDMVYMLTDLYPFPLNSRVSGAAQILSISRRGLLDQSEPWRQVGVIYEDEYYPARLAAAHGVELSMPHNAIHTGLKRHHNPSFVKAGDGNLLDPHRLRIYFTSADDTPASDCPASHGETCAEWSYKLWVVEAALH